MLVAREPMFPFLGLRRYMSSINDYLSGARSAPACFLTNISTVSQLSVAFHGGRARTGPGGLRSAPRLCA